MTNPFNPGDKVVTNGFNPFPEDPDSTKLVPNMVYDIYKVSDNFVYLTESPYFWNDRHGSERAHDTVFDHRRFDLEKAAPTYSDDPLLAAAQEALDALRDAGYTVTATITRVVTTTEKITL